MRTPFFRASRAASRLPHSATRAIRSDNGRVLSVSFRLSAPSAVCSAARSRVEAEFSSGEFAIFSKPAAGAAPRSTFMPVGSLAIRAPDFARASSSTYLRARISTTAGSKCLPDSDFTMSMAASSGRALRYWRSDASASRQSTAARMRAPRGICSPASPSGYPLPFHFS